MNYESQTEKLAEALVAASSALTSTLEYDEVINRIFVQIGKVVPHDTANVMLIEGEMARVHRGQGYERFGTVSQLGEIVFEWMTVPGLLQIVAEKRPLTIPDVSQYDQWVVSLPAHKWIQSYIGVPLLIHDEVIGFLNVMSATANFFQERDAERLLALAHYAASAIHNAQLYRQAQEELERRKQVEAELLVYQSDLEQLVEKRTNALQAECLQRQHLETKQAVEEERQRIAREVHDGALQSLLGVRLRLLHIMQMETTNAAETEFTELIDEVLHIARMMRSLISQLHTQELSSGLPAALLNLVMQLQKTYAVKVHTDIFYMPNTLTVAQEHHLIRIAREAMTNACNHGQASDIWLQVDDREENGRFAMHIKDNGIGFAANAAAREGWGIKNMRQRTRLIGGNFQLKSEVGKGAWVRVIIDDD